MEIQKFLTLIEDIIREKVSDLHLTSNDFPYIRNHVGEIVAVESFGKLFDEDIKDICDLLLSRDFSEQTIDVSFEYKEARFRVNISHVLRGISIAFRMIPSVIPKQEDILMPDHLLRMAQAQKGIILVT